MHLTVRSLLYAPLLLILISCGASSTPESTFDTITVNQAGNEEADFNDFFQKMEFIDLEESDSPIGMIEKVYLTEQILIVVDKSVSKAIYIFTPEGKSVATVKAVGKGPGEFVSLTDAAYDPYKKRILVYDRAQKKVLFYDLKGGFIDEKPVESYFINFEVCGEEKYALFKYQEGHHLAIVDQEFDELSTYLPPVESKLTVSTANPFLRYGQKVSFASFYDPFIYAIDSLSEENGFELLPQVKIDYQNNVPESEIWPITKERSGKVLTQYAAGPTDFAQTRDHLFFTYANQGKPSAVLHDKVSGETLEYPITYRKDVSLSPVVGATEEAIIVPYSMSDLQSWSTPQTGPLGQQFNQLVNWAKDQSESDQSVLVLYYP